MKERVNKPRAFLSYASEDLAFIERIERDLRNCQIEIWRDRTEIRDGQPWQEAIFEDGLPTCDVIVAYFTDSSVSSGMVAKEVDAAQIRHLKDSGVSFLPYVNKSETREKLRLDIQSLHCRVWNDENYHETLPTVVAEIWRSYMERNLGNAVLHERNKRLELEVELQALKLSMDSSGFSSQEEKEFRYIFRKLNVSKEMSIQRSYPKTAPLAARFSFLKFLLSFTGAPYRLTFDQSEFQNHVMQTIVNDHLGQGYIAVEIKEPLSVELRTYGLIELIAQQQDPFAPLLELRFTPKLDRFRFWVEVNELSADTELYELSGT